ncbi:MAG: ABC transporter permease, partial [Pseudomonadota bacterium]
MADMTASGPMLAADGRPLKQSLARSLRREKLRALLLISPLLLFVLVSFLIPIASMLFRSVENDIVQNTLPETVVALQQWDATSGQLPGEEVYAAFVRDMLVAVDEKTHTRLGTRLNYEETGMSSMFRRSGRAIGRLDAVEDAPFKDKLIDIHDGWGEVQTWAVIKTHSVRYTDGYFLNAIDMQRTPEGPMAQPENRQILVTLFGRTLQMSLIITGFCILLGYPVAWL